MSKDKHPGEEPEFSMSPEDEAFLRLVEDSYEAAGSPKDQPEADRVWGKLESRLTGAKADNVRPIQSARSSRSRVWTWASGALGVAAALVLFINNQKPATEAPGTMQVRGAASGFSAAIKVYDEQHHVKVKVLAESDGYVALFRQNGEAPPVFVSNLVFRKEQGETNMLEEETSSGTRYCIVGAKDQDGLKHLVDLIQDLWLYLPKTSCYSVP